MAKNEIGSITWIDLTVQNADEIRDFYQNVVGWIPETVDMGGYSDYNMKSPETNEPRTGVCHARGGNANLPAQWLIYIMSLTWMRASRTVGAKGER